MQELAQQSQTMERETWDSLLSFLLAINDALLAPPAVKDDVGDQLCERVLGVLYEIWLIACVKSFPGPTLWKTFQVWLYQKPRYNQGCDFVHYTLFYINASKMYIIYIFLIFVHYTLFLSNMYIILLIIHYFSNFFVKCVVQDPRRGQ